MDNDKRKSAGGVETSTADIDVKQLHSSTNDAWLKRLETLLERFSYLGISADITALSLIELWGLYLFLSRLADG